jgi:hypothetical protein
LRGAVGPTDEPAHVFVPLRPQRATGDANDANRE